VTDVRDGLADVIRECGAPGDLADAVLASGLVVPADEAVHIHHHDIERHAESYNEGYAAAEEHLGPDIAHLDRLAAQVAAVRALCQDTAGNWLHPEADVPVGEFQAVLDVDDGTYMRDHRGRVVDPFAADLDADQAPTTEEA